MTDTAQFVEKAWTFMDRTGWGTGPWDGEPDKVEWRDEQTGLPCIARRSPASGAWCGYVAVPEGHPHFGEEYDDVDVEVHGGLTFASPCQEGEDDHGICHIPMPGEPDRVYWFGFDCNHTFDTSPGSRYGSHGDSLVGVMAGSGLFDLADSVCNDGLPEGQTWDEYRTLDYVRSEVARLADQLADV